jgi:hypothetical protein
MSLVCHECGDDMGPSQALPGREGVMVHPIVKSMIYVPKKLKIQNYSLEYIMAPQNRSLCFSCIERKLPDNRKEILNRIYECYKAETAYEEIKASNKGKWSSDPTYRDSSEALEDLEKKFNLLEKNCLFCGEDVHKENKPYFHAWTIEKVYSSKNLSGLFQRTNYSFSDFETGQTHIKFCFEDFKKNFPRNFEQLGYDMLGKNAPNNKKISNELYLSQTIIDECVKEGKESQKLLKSLIKDMNVKIIESENNKGKN